MPFLSSVRSGAAALSAAAVLASALALVPSASQADDSSTVTFVGTSDTFDSGLVSNVLKPGFEKAYPQYAFNYVSQGTDAAIAYARAGSASGLLVHAASLENQFVADGYSNEKYGRAVFWGDYVLLGPEADPVGVMATASHDVVGAFEKIAAAGANGTANFVSRGKAPGTTVAEHAIWKLATGSTLCDVSTGSGGGASPYNGTGTCASAGSYPSWYHATGTTQAPNLTIANNCQFDGGNCYVLTDRGTFNYLQTHPAGNADTVDNLKVVTRNNAAASRGGPNLLINSFHAYAINPGANFGGGTPQLNTKGATAFLNWVTSPSGQAQVKKYLHADTPFIPSAAPSLTAATGQTRVRSGHSLKVAGSLKNVIPGTPALGGAVVRLNSVDASGKVTAVDGSTTDANGNYAIYYRPKASQRYTVSVGQISKIENASLNPVFGDLLTATSTAVRKVYVTAASPRITKVTKSGKYIRVRGILSPRVAGRAAHLSLYAAHSDVAKKKGLHYITKRALKSGSNRFDVRFKLSRTTWTFKVMYVNSGVTLPALSAAKKVALR